MIPFQLNDGGRPEGKRAKDCVTRAVAIASGLPYQKSMGRSGTWKCRTKEV
jgi:hypothetical protein